MNIQVTEAAKEILIAENPEEKSIRVYVSGIG